MARMTPSEFAPQVGTGLLSFPVTCFKDDLSFDEAKYRDHVAWLGQRKVAGLFAAGGTGEFFSLALGEIEKIVAAAVAETAGRVPVIAGTGYGTAIAKELAAAAERAGADGLLLLPHYLTEAPPEGVAAHVEAVCRSTRLGVIFYHRDRARINEELLERVCARCPNLVGFKDGVGDIELMTRIYARLGDRLTYIGGLPTAETFALPYRELGVGTYSSAIFNFLPEWALDFYDAVRRRDRDTVYTELRRFVLPYIAIRSRKPGYAVSIVKAGMRAIGRSAGPLRPPLTELRENEFAELVALIDAVSGRADARHEDRRRQAAGRSAREEPMSAVAEPVSITAVSGAADMRRRVIAIAGASSGNLVEWYDFYTYSFTALYFASAFFPSGDRASQLLNTAGIFAAGFFMRPLGGWLFGHIADRHGRRTAMMTSVLMMCFGSLMIALLPTHATIGAAAPALLLAARLIQGLSVGGEYGTSATYMSEVAAPGRRGFYASFQYVTLIGGQLVALLVLVTLQAFLTGDEIKAWGWRVPFVIGAVAAIVALFLRRSLAETASQESMRAKEAGTITGLLPHKRAVALVLGFTAGGSLIFYTFTTYMQKYLVNTAGMDTAKAST